jgi:PAS domain S-box-containing protein
VDRGHRIRTWNASAERLFGWSAEDAIGRSFMELVPESRRAVKMGRLHRAFEGERLEIEFGELRSADGRTLHLSMSFSPVRDASGAIVEAAILCGDLSRQRELEDQLLQAQKMEVVGRLAGGIAHDFNNMLTAILGFSELLRPRVAQDAEATQSVEQVVLAAERASSLTQRLLAFSRRRPRAAEHLDVDQMLQRLVPLFRRLLGEDLELEVRSRAPGAHVVMDPTQFEQVLLNLVINARDAMPLGGRIVIETKRLPDDPARPALDPGLPGGATVLIRVTDTGVGMDAATRARIFEPFFTTKEAGRGTGLGLSTVLAIVQEMHGAIRVQSAPGQGTSFSVHLPESETAMSAPTVRSGPPGAIEGAERVLVVEDEPLVRDFLVACLGSSGYQVEVAGSAEQALEWALERELPFDLLVSDIVLPRLSGVELAGRLREVRLALPVLFLSGYGEALFEGRLPGQLLSKPFTRDSLLAAVREVLETRASVDALR